MEVVVGVEEVVGAAAATPLPRHATPRPLELGPRGTVPDNEHLG